MRPPDILIACVGNIFLGDDAFGVEVAHALQDRLLPSDVRVIDFGIRGLDLTYALMEGYSAVILVDASPQGEPPGTLFVLEPDRTALSERPCAMETHNVDPAKVLRLAKTMGGDLGRIVLVGCEPTPLDDYDEMQIGLSEPVRRAVIQAVPLIESLISALRMELDTSTPNRK